jgi:catechol 2,3-dioxygenase-like lactoylglutathione lyase family enzyme
MFDHVALAVSDLAASERFYGTVLSVLGVEPGHADAELVEWDDWDIMPADRRVRPPRLRLVGVGDLPRAFRSDRAAYPRRELLFAAIRVTVRGSRWETGAVAPL